jgi:4-hydroxy-3-polyprenylbenzoate decarboxylase
MNIVIAITGATGTCFGIRLLEVMKELKINTHLIISKWATFINYKKMCKALPK